jgi:triacylglycerol esterase/lipase EstA (alpha/beta hydrolase family)
MGTRTRTSLVVALLSVVIGASALVSAPAQAGSSAPRALSLTGANDWSCKPTRAHPTPVVIVHGTFGDSRNLLQRLTWSIHSVGYCVYALDYGNRATGPIEDSAAQLKAFIDKVLASTGAAKVSMVGHSQGGMMPRYYIKFLGGASKVDDLVGLSPSNHGTSQPVLLVPGLGYACPSCLQQKTGSAFLTHLNAGDETPGPVSYTNIATSHDEVVLPYTSGFLAGPNTTNIRLQDRCPFDLVDHLLIPSDGPAIRLALNALGRSGPADPSYRPSCLP